MLEATEAETVLRLPLRDFQGKNALFTLIRFPLPSLVPFQALSLNLRSALGADGPSCGCSLLVSTDVLSGSCN